jgi:hypothetical protein
MVHTGIAIVAFAGIVIVIAAALLRVIIFQASASTIQ